MRWRSLAPRSLRLRITLATALISALVGLGAAGLAAVLVDELSTAAEDQRLRDTAALLQSELELGGTPAEHADEESREIAPLGVRLALFANGVRLGGAADVAYAAQEGCSSRVEHRGAVRSCALGPESRRIVVSTLRAAHESRLRVLLLAVGAAALLAAAVSALASRALAGWALAPLTALGKRIEHVPSVAPGSADLGESSGTAEVEALRETIRELLRRLGVALERSRGFAANAAHELRTPLATMMAEIDLAQERAPEARESFVRVRRTLERLSVLVERLLSLASDSAAAPMTDAVAMEDIVRDVVGAREMRDQARIKVTLDEPGMVRGDETILRVVVDNLVDNALKFSTSEVRVRVEERKHEVSVVVADEGSGIRPGAGERLLLPFERDGDAGIPGHGLGLAIVAHAVHLHGGAVRFVSRDRGTEVEVCFPAWSGGAR